MGDAHPLRRPARRLLYGEKRAAVEREIDKLVNAGIAHSSTSPLASPIYRNNKKQTAVNGFASTMVASTQ